MMTPQPALFAANVSMIFTCGSSRDSRVAACSFRAYLQLASIARASASQ